jgi:hypothetical protein
VLGVLVALGSAAAYAFGVTLQAVEARETPAEESLKLSLLRDLFRRRRWLAGTACVVVGWILQAAALMLAPITVVQPAMAMSIVVLLVIGMRRHEEGIGPSEAIGATAIIVGVIGLASVAPGHGEGDAAPVTLAIGMSVLGVVALLPYLISAAHRHLGGFVVAIGAGMSYAWTGFSTKFLADGFASKAWLVAGIWLAATAGAAIVGLLSEMTALQERSAIRVFPIVLVVQIVVAVLLAPLLAGETWEPNPLNASVLAGSLIAVALGTRQIATCRVVGRVVATT